jgi:hypothetical protein
MMKTRWKNIALALVAIFPIFGCATFNPHGIVQHTAIDTWVEFVIPELDKIGDTQYETIFGTKKLREMPPFSIIEVLTRGIEVINFSNIASQKVVEEQNVFERIMKIRSKSFQ